MLLIYGDENSEVQLSDEERSAMYERYRAFNEETQQRGVYEAADELQPTSTATTVRLRNGQVLTTDGPFAESKEQLGGYYILDCENLDEAIELAAKIPSAETGSIEVRPIMVY
jgi:hypothetical protein